MGIFFELIKNDLPLFLIGNGDNRIHFVSAAMLNYSIKKSLNFKKSNIYNIGSVNTIKLYDMFNKLIKKTNSKSKIICLNKNLFNFIFNILKKLRIIDFNNYHKLMFSSNIVLDLSKIQKKLNLNFYKENNLDLMFNAYKYFCRNYKNIKNIKQGSDKFPDNKIIILIKFFKWLF